MKTHLSLERRIHNAALSQEAENVKARHQYLPTPVATEPRSDHQL